MGRAVLPATSMRLLEHLCLFLAYLLCRLGMFFLHDFQFCFVKRLDPGWSGWCNRFPCKHNDHEPQGNQDADDDTTVELLFQGSLTSFHTKFRERR